MSKFQVLWLNITATYALQSDTTAGVRKARVVNLVQFAKSLLIIKDCLECIFIVQSRAKFSSVE